MPQAPNRCPCHPALAAQAPRNRRPGGPRVRARPEGSPSTARAITAGEWKFHEPSALLRRQPLPLSFHSSATTHHRQTGPCHTRPQQSGPQREFGPPRYAVGANSGMVLLELPARTRHRPPVRWIEPHLIRCRQLPFEPVVVLSRPACSAYWRRQHINLLF